MRKFKIGCKVNHRDQYGQTPIYYAAREGHMEVMEKLIKIGADVNNEDLNGETCLFYAARQGHLPVVVMLVANKINVNKQDKKKQTALHMAKKNKREEVVKFLMENGAIPVKEVSQNKEKPDKKGKTQSKQPDKMAPKKYVLTVYKDGTWRPLNDEEMKAFKEKNKEVAEYLQDPSKIEKMKLPPMSQSAQIYDHWDKAAKRIIVHLWKQTGAWHFHQPVDAEALRILDYHNIIKSPMDLGTIKQKLATSAYAKCKEFVADVELVFNNCITYNGEASDFGVLAKNMKEEFKKQCQLLSLDFYMIN